MATLGVAVCSVAVAGCGGTTQATHEPKGYFPVKIASVSFPSKQRISKPSTLRIKVENAGSRALPNVAITVDSFSYHAPEPPVLADNERPTWIVDTGPGPIAKPPVESAEVLPPGGAQTAFVHTWALRRLAPGAAKIFRWRLTPVVAGTHTIHFTVAAGLNGKAKATLPSSHRRPTGTLTVHVAPKPEGAHVNPTTGAVATGVWKAATGPVGAVP